MLARKLDFLMNLTGTQNSTLGKVLNFDASYISRIRNGKRGVPKHQPFIEPAAAYFAQQIKDPYQKRAAMEMISPSRKWPESEEEVRSLIAIWLSNNKDYADSTIGHFLSGLSASCAPSPADQMPPSHLPPSDKLSCFYGNEGKRRGVEIFLSRICMQTPPPELLLYSDEDMTWLYEDVPFAKRWSALLTQYITSGGRIKIIHTISRNINDMLEAINKWIPLYMSGRIEPYFYPKIRDDVYHRTLFVASGHSALISYSVGCQTSGRLNLLISDKDAVAALAMEFYDYFALCRPLVQFYNRNNPEAFLSVLSEFGARDGGLIMAGSVPSFLTLPAELSGVPPFRQDIKGSKKRLEQITGLFWDTMRKGFPVTEILHLPAVSDVSSGTQHIPLSDMFCTSGVSYKPEDLRRQLETVLELSAQEENYHLLLSDSLPSNIILISKEDTGTLVFRNTVPSTVLAVTELRMSEAFYEYLHRIYTGGQKKEKTIEQLEAYIREY